jgi:hypothetical protein
MEHQAMAGDGGNCQEVIKKFIKSGVNVDVLASQLQKEGAVICQIVE